jgi:hypothetical protein
MIETKVRLMTNQDMTSTTAVLNLVPPPGKYYYLVLSSTSAATSAGTGLKNSKNDEPFLLNSQDAPCLN